MSFFGSVICKKSNCAMMTLETVSSTGMPRNTMRYRIVFLGMPVDDTVSNVIIAQLLFLQMTDPKKDIHLYINSPGGSVTAGLAIYDTMQLLPCDANTYCIGSH